MSREAERTGVEGLLGPFFLSFFFMLRTLFLIFYFYYFSKDEYGTSLLYQALYECFEAFPALPGQRVGNTTLEAFIEKFLDMYTQVRGPI